jgi:hypothetical protein
MIGLRAARSRRFLFGRCADDLCLQSTGNDFRDGMRAHWMIRPRDIILIYTEISPLKI